MKNCFTLIIVLSIAVCSVAQSVYQETTIDVSSASGVGARIIGTHDGGSLIVGSIGNAQQDNIGDVVVVKIDAFKNVQWAKRFSSTYQVIDLFGNVCANHNNLEYGGAGVETDDGYVIAGSVNRESINLNPLSSCNTPVGYLVDARFDGLLLKLNKNTGELIWQKRFSTGQNSVFTDLQTTSDGGFLITGVTVGSRFGEAITTPPFHGVRPLYIKTNAEGTVEWNQILSGAGLELIAGSFALGSFRAPIIELPDNQGFMYAAGAAERVFWGVLDVNGNPLWSKKSNIGNALGGYSEALQVGAATRTIGTINSLLRLPNGHYAAVGNGVFFFGILNLNEGLFTTSAHYGLVMELDVPSASCIRASIVSHGTGTANILTDFQITAASVKDDNTLHLLGVNQSHSVLAEYNLPEAPAPGQAPVFESVNWSKVGSYYSYSYMPLGCTIPSMSFKSADRALILTGNFNLLETTLDAGAGNCTVYDFPLTALAIESPTFSDAGGQTNTLNIAVSTGALASANMSIAHVEGCSTTVGIRNNSAGSTTNMQLNIFPNPTNSEHINITWDQAALNDSPLFMVCATFDGRILGQTEISNNGSYSMPLPADWRNGLYVIYFKNETGILGMRKFVKFR